MSRGDVDGVDVVERARRIAANLDGALMQAAATAADETVEPGERARAYLTANATEGVWIVADTAARAQKWARDNELRKSRWVQAAANLYNLDGAFVVVLPGAESHREWRRVAKHLSHLRGTGLAHVVVVEDALGEVVGGIDLRGDTFAPLPMQPGQRDELLVREHGMILASLDRDTVQRLIRTCQAFLDAEPAPNPDADEAERIRREIAATGDPFGRST